MYSMKASSPVLALYRLRRGIGINIQYIFSEFGTSGSVEHFGEVRYEYQSSETHGQRRFRYDP